ncbi:hypothetical protein CEXT_526341 [Caerostris extrusa]|uniref:Uncharacterized protein n=1 Tax=Caerostris extrusa TaxID=172846 RepID=A0AAV4T7H0_CAEEX|nr:hypothetical protein CEXT_526341 [Caerostris extrusa]
MRPLSSTVNLDMRYFKANISPGSGFLLSQSHHAGRFSSVSIGGYFYKYATNRDCQHNKNGYPHYAQPLLDCLDSYIEFASISKTSGKIL